MKMDEGEEGGGGGAGVVEVEEVDGGDDEDVGPSERGERVVGGEVELDRRWGFCSVGAVSRGGQFEVCMW